MPWETIECSDGAWEINREGVARIMRSHAWSRAAYENSSVDEETHVFGPDLLLVDTDWPSVRKDTDTWAKAYYEDFFTRLANGDRGANGLKRLADLVDEKDSFDDQFQEMKRKAQRTTMVNIQTSVDLGEDSLPVLEAIRDVSVDAFLIGATILSGGTLSPATTALIGAGSVVKGLGKWEDTGRFQDGVVEASTEFVFGVVGVGVRGLNASGPMKWALAFAIAANKSSVEVIKQNMSGKSIVQSMGRGGLKLADPVVSAIAKTVLSNEAWAVPVTAVLKYAEKKGVDKLTTPAKAKQETPQLTIVELIDLARPTDDYVQATAIQRYPGMSRKF